MTPLVASLPLLGILLNLLAYWLWKRADEAATDADLQKRFWDQSKYQRQYRNTEVTPLDAAEWFKREQIKYRWLAWGVGLLGMSCFGYGLYLLFNIPAV